MAGSMNLYSQFESAFRRAGDAPALVGFEGANGSRETWSYARLRQEAERTAGALASFGIEPGDRVLAQVEKTPQAVALYLACLKIGAVYVPLNTAYTPPEIRHFLADAEPALFVAGREFDTPVRQAVLDRAGLGSLTTRAASATPVGQTTPRNGGDLAAIIYTSGTTGRAKGAMLSHANLASNATTLCEYWGWQADDVLLHALPIFHVHGLFVALHCAFLNATPVIFHAKFDVDAVLRELPRATVLMGVPTFYTRLLTSDRFDAQRCANMRLFISGSAPLAAQTFASFQQRTGHRILERYGMSETGMNTSNPLHGERLAGTVGFALPGVEVRIADERGKPLPSGTVGAIEVRGANVFEGYWRLPSLSASEFRDDGFFVTGDLGTMDAEGRVAIVGRSKDLVISGGYNVYPKEVETLLDDMPGVRESAVIGVPHADFGEAVVAVLATDRDDIDEAAVDAFLGGKLARYKQPKRVVRVRELPRNVMGKVQKNALRESYRHVAAAAQGNETRS